MTSLEEHLWQRWGGGQEQCPTRASTPNHPAKAPQRAQQRDDDSCDHALAETREAHWWALAATHLLEERIERLSHWQPEHDQVTASAPIAVATPEGNLRMPEEAH